MADAIRKGRRCGTVYFGGCLFSTSRTPGWRLVCGLAGRAKALLLAPWPNWALQGTLIRRIASATPYGRP